MPRSCDRGIPPITGQALKTRRTFAASTDYFHKNKLIHKLNNKWTPPTGQLLFYTTYALKSNFHGRRFIRCSTILLGSEMDSDG